MPTFLLSLFLIYASIMQSVKGFLPLTLEVSWNQHLLHHLPPSPLWHQSFLFQKEGGQNMQIPQKQNSAANLTVRFQTLKLNSF